MWLLVLRYVVMSVMLCGYECYVVMSGMLCGYECYVMWL
jgi:hypothetical protein